MQHFVKSYTRPYTVTQINAACNSNVDGYSEEDNALDCKSCSSLILPPEMIFTCLQVKSNPESTFTHIVMTAISGKLFVLWHGKLTKIAFDFRILS